MLSSSSAIGQPESYLNTGKAIFRFVCLSILSIQYGVAMSLLGGERNFGNTGDIGTGLLGGSGAWELIQPFTG